MAIDERIRAFHQAILPVFSSHVDPICIVDGSNKIVYQSLAMGSLLGIRRRDLARGAVFCDVVKLSVCQKGCEVLKAIRSGVPLRLDEAPARIGGNLCRLTVRVTPFREPSAPRSADCIGAVITARDTTGDVLLLAKYHKLLSMVEQRDDRLAELEEEVQKLRGVLRRSRS